MFGLTYDLWNEIINDAVEAHAPLFLAMHRAAEDLQVSPDLVESLKQNGAVELKSDDQNFVLEIDFIEDKIDGFRILLLAAEDLESFETIKADAAMDHGITPEDIEGFELEHGLELDEAIFEEMEDSYQIIVELDEQAVLFELVIFDSQDLDDARISDEAWRDDASAN